MTDARATFFDNMERELLESAGDPSILLSSNVDLDFSVTESGRTVTHLVAESQRSEMDFSIVESSRTTADSEGIHTAREPPPARSIPVPQSEQQGSMLQPSSQASSQGSSGSAFLSSVLNANAGLHGSNNAAALLSHTPPKFGSSYETSHFGKRARSGSVSGRLRSASEYLEDKGLLDRETKGILKDLIIIGDEELQNALDQYESGDPSALEEMISSGGLQQRLPADLDLLGDLDLDFLSMNDPLDAGNVDTILPHPGTTLAYKGVVSSYAPSQTLPMHGQLSKPSMVTPQYDDGIGDLDFNDFGSDGDYIIPHPTMDRVGSGKVATTSSPSAETYMTEYEKRMRSNSLFSALLNEPTSGRESVESEGKQPPSRLEGHYEAWMDKYTDAALTKPRGIQIGRAAAPRRSSLPSGIGASIEADKARRKQEKKGKKEKQKASKDDIDIGSDREMEYRIPGSGRPRSLSDPNLRIAHDELGLLQVERPDGWIGAYSPDSRKVRIERFLEKRNHRVWSKSIKYDVRKNFADSRLRVKGRFVRKEDESLMRELMSLT